MRSSQGQPGVGAEQGDDGVGLGAGTGRGGWAMAREGRGPGSFFFFFLSLHATTGVGPSSPPHILPDQTETHRRDGRLGLDYRTGYWALGWVAWHSHRPRQAHSGSRWTERIVRCLAGGLSRRIRGGAARVVQCRAGAVQMNPGT